MAGEDLDLVVFLGDYIYEDEPDPEAVRQHTGAGELVTLDEYRARYALYRSDPALQLAHAAFPWAVAFDDHEQRTQPACRLSQLPPWLRDRARSANVSS
jgi:alkaline phosphatase D